MLNRSVDFIHRIASALAFKLKGATLEVCFSQHKDELVMGFALPTEDFWIVADLTPEASVLYFPIDFSRAKRNSVDLFGHLIGLKVSAIFAHESERSFQINFNRGHILVFKMHGRNSNVILFNAGVTHHASDVFRHNLEKDLEIDLSMLKQAQPVLASLDALLEANIQFDQFKRTYFLEKEKNSLLKSLKAKIERTQNYLIQTEKKLKEIEGKSNYDKIANILMANVHLKTVNQPTIELFDFYENTNRIIKLKQDQTLQKNAESYYRKAKNQKIEEANVQKNLANKHADIVKWQQLISLLEPIENVKELRILAKNNGLITSKVEEKEEFPFIEKIIDGFKIWIGKNSKNNDLLTVQYAHKEDLWLHAKDVSGSHVVIKHQAGKNFPKPVIERAAELAAYHSKRKNDTLAPVTYTPRKFVRKNKGMAPGMVIVEREEVVLVAPKP